MIKFGQIVKGLLLNILDRVELSNIRPTHAITYNGGRTLSAGDCNKNILPVAACNLSVLIHKTTYLITKTKSI